MLGYLCPSGTCHRRELGGGGARRSSSGGRRRRRHQRRRGRSWRRPGPPGPSRHRARALCIGGGRRADAAVALGASIGLSALAAARAPCNGSTRGSLAPARPVPGCATQPANMSVLGLQIAVQEVRWRAAQLRASEDWLTCDRRRRRRRDDAGGGGSGAPPADSISAADTGGAAAAAVLVALQELGPALLHAGELARGAAVLDVRDVADIIYGRIWHRARSCYHLFRGASLGGCLRVRGGSAGCSCRRRCRPATE